jgi:SAM-dependent methyltransferase
MSRWSEIHRGFLQEKDIGEVIREKTRYKRRLLTQVANESGPILEVGCGTAMSLIWLATQGRAVAGVDSDPETVALASRLSFATRLRIPIVCADIRALPFSDDAYAACFSNGVMEHFDDATIKMMVLEQLRVAHRVYLSVPSAQYMPNQRIYGDERFMTSGEWTGILTSYVRIAHTFGFHHQPSWRQRLMAPIDIDAYQFLCFVLERYSP